MGPEAAAPSARAAMAFAARANMPASLAVTAAAVNVPVAVVPSQPSQSSRGRQLKASERKSNKDVPGPGISPILTDIGLISIGVSIRTRQTYGA